MANNTITFNPDSNAAYGVNLTILEGADFSSTFQINNENKSSFNLTGYTIYAKMKKSDVTDRRSNVMLPLQL